MATNPTVGSRIEEIRKSRGMSKSQLAQLVKVSPTAVWNWEENGVTPRPAMTKTIAKALGVTEAFLLAGQTTAPHLRTASEIIAAAAAEIATLNGVPLSKVKIDWQIA